MCCLCDEKHNEIVDDPIDSKEDSDDDDDDDDDDDGDDDDDADADADSDEDEWRSPSSSTSLSCCHHFYFSACSFLTSSMIGKTLDEGEL